MSSNYHCRALLVLKFEEHTTGVAQAVSELATLFPEVSRLCTWGIPILYMRIRMDLARSVSKDQLNYVK